MRLRNLKNKSEIINNSEYVVKDSEKYIGKWNSLFDNSNPIYIEIGMGKGKFIVENAINNPNINYIGIEKVDNVLARALPNIPVGLNNLKILRLNAQDIDLCFNKEVDLVYLNFSDPWPKSRHADRRLTSKIFLEKYDKIFKGEPSIQLRTDNYNLFRYSIESLSQYGYGLYDVSFDLHNEATDLITTEYEDKFVSNGDNIYYLHAIKSFTNK
jgi:tRNA (guanine-N(7)-)-methyltransferase